MPMANVIPFPPQPRPVGAPRAGAAVVRLTSVDFRRLPLLPVRRSFAAAPALPTRPARPPRRVTLRS